MKRPPAIVYVGRARSAAEAFPCSSCYAEVAEPCRPMAHMPSGTHRCRIDMAEAIGLRDVAALPLLEAGR